MSPNPESFLGHLRDEGYHPRSNKHSNALAQAIVDDLLRHCPKIRQKAAAGEVVYDFNFTLMAGTADWNVDLVLGAPELGTARPPEGHVVLRARPSFAQVAVEIKSVMTEHRKAVKNRKRDLEAHHEHVHNYNASAIAGGVLVINASPVFKSPLRLEKTLHSNPSKLVEHCIGELRAVALRRGSTGYGLDARCAIVVALDNLENEKASYVSSPPAPVMGDPLHYDAFIRTMCEEYTRRF